MLSEKFDWDKYKLQIIGAGLLILAGFLGLIGEIGLAWVALAGAGAITLSCALRNKWGNPTRTVSQWIQDLTTNKLVDYAVGSGIIVVAGWKFFAQYGFEKGLEIAFWPFVCGLSIHLFANKD